MSKLTVLFLLFLIVSATLAAPHRRRWRGSNRRYGQSSFNNRRGPNQGLKAHGATKTLIGAGLLGAGILGGNQGLANAGGALVKLGLASKVAAHFLKRREAPTPDGPAPQPIS